MPGLPLVIIPHPMAKRPADEVATIVDGVIDEIERALGADAEELQAAYKQRQPESGGRLRYHSLFEGNFNAPDAPESFKAPEELEAVNTLLYRRGWTDGLPVIPPTRERFEAILDGWDGEALLGLIEPKLGKATAAKVAANAVMAGARPEHFSIIAAAARGLAEPKLNLKALQTTTHPCTVLALVHGPIAETVGLNATYNAMGQGRLANAAIGRSVRFILLNIGGAAPGVLDRSTQGSPAKYAFCFAENAADNPWEPLAVERGFRAEQSALTLAGVEGPHNVNDHYGKTGEEVLLTLCGTLAITGANNSYLGGEIIVALGPEHAEVIARDGFGKDEVKRFLIEHAVIPGRHINESQAEMMRRKVADRFVDGDWKKGARIFSRPEEIMLTVAGGAGRHSSVIFSFGNTASVTVPILDAQGRAL